MDPARGATRPTAAPHDGGSGASQRGRLRVYLGSAPGVGKTFAMLGEGARRAARGSDVVVGYVETHGRARTEAALADLEVVPRLYRRHRDHEFPELDLDAVLARRPDVVLIDELAHTNVPGGRHEKRWQDVEDLLGAGIDVVTTVNVQHLESLNDVVQKITGVAQRETVPDAVVRAADQVELVDMSPEALRRRMAHGNVYPAERIDAALSHYFRVGNLSALRELALLWVADRVEEGLQRYRQQHAIGTLWETRERVVVALTGGPEGEALVRRGARIAARATGGDLLAVHVVRSDGLTGASSADLAAQRRLVESLGGSFHSVLGEDVPTALLDFARAEGATQLVLGVSRRGRWSTFFGGSGIGQTVTRLSGDIDVHLVTHDRAARPRALPALAGGLSPRRRLAGAVLALVLTAGLTASFAAARAEVNETTEALGFLLAVVVVALVGGLYPALGAAALSLLALNWFFTDPLYTLRIADGNDVVALVTFVAVAIMVSAVVDGAARRLQVAARATAEAETLSILAGSVLRGERALPALVERLRETFGLTSVALLQRTPGPAPGTPRSATGPDVDPDGTASEWVPVAVAGPDPWVRPGAGDEDDEPLLEVPVGEDAVLTLRGRPIRAADRRVLAAFTAQAAGALERRRLAERAADVAPLAAADRMRTALLNAVSHDLRTPLAAATLAVGSLNDPGVTWSASDRAELLATAAESLDRLGELVANLLDMSRLEAGVLRPRLGAVRLEELVPRVLHALGEPAVRAPDMAGVPPLRADAGLLERVVENLVRNALSHGRGAGPPVLAASAHQGRVEMRVVDHGPGVADASALFQPFQRLGDRDPRTGVGLGLALSRGLVDAMHGTLEAEETPGGGLTMVLSLPVCLVDDLASTDGGAVVPKGVPGR